MANIVRTAPWPGRRPRVGPGLPRPTSIDQQVEPTPAVQRAGCTGVAGARAVVDPRAPPG